MNPAQPSRTLEAVSAYDDGHWAVAEVLARDAIRANDKDAAAWNLLGKIAMDPRVNLPGHAVRFLQRAVAVNPGFRPASKNLRVAEARAKNAAPPTREGVCVIREWGAGFWSDVNHVLGGALLAEMTGRTPVVWWGGHSLYNPGGVNAWEQYFEPLSIVNVTDAAIQRPAWPPKWGHADPLGPIPSRWNGPDSRVGALAFLGRTEPVLVVDFFADPSALAAWMDPEHPWATLPFAALHRQLAARYLKPKPPIVEAVDRFARQHFAGRRVIAAHWRGTDKLTELVGAEHLPREVQTRTDGLMAEFPEAVLFLMTDSAPLLHEARARYGARLVTTESTRSSTDLGVHFSGHDPERVGREVLIDTLLACQADRFVGLGMSNVGCLVRSLKEWGDGACELVGPVVVEEPNFVHYLMPQQDAAPRKI